MKKNEIELVSPHPPEECTARLLAAIDLDRPFRGRGSKAVAGEVSGRSVFLHKQIAYRNSFKTYLMGTLEPQGGGTVLRGKTRLEPGTFVLLFFVFGAVILCWVLPFGAGLLQGSVGVIVPPLLLILLVVLVVGGRYQARDEGRFLVAFMAEVLEARPNSQTQSPKLRKSSPP